VPDHTTDDDDLPRAPDESDLLEAERLVARIREMADKTLVTLREGVGADRADEIARAKRGESVCFARDPDGDLDVLRKALAVLLRQPALARVDYATFLCAFSSTDGQEAVQFGSLMQHLAVTPSAMTMARALPLWISAVRDLKGNRVERAMKTLFDVLWLIAPASMPEHFPSWEKRSRPARKLFQKARDDLPALREWQAQQKK
jgi:hypothetical protein